MTPIAQQYPLQDLHTFGISAYAAYYAAIPTETALVALLQSGALAGQSLTVLGGGSNMVFTADIAGAVLHNCIKGREVIARDADYVWVKAGGGEGWHDLVQWCIAQGFGGIENLSLIPGTVGAAPIQNIGAYGVELKDVFHELAAIRLADGSAHTFGAAACAFGYRDSIFKQLPFRNQYFITAVTLRLTHTRHRLSLEYGAIGDYLAKAGIIAPTIGDVGAAVSAIRRSKLPDPAVLGNAGSFFKNPTIHLDHFLRLKAAFPALVYFPTEHPDRFKIPAGWLIEQCGWRGRAMGRVGCYHLQALVLVNLGGATGDEVVALSQAIRRDVMAKFDIELETEVNIF